MYQLLKIVTFTLLTLVVLAACKPMVGAMPKVPNPAIIDLNPTGPAGPIDNPGGFQVETPNRGCLKGSGLKKGCVRFAADEDGTITFALNGRSPAKTCDQNAVRVITKIELTATDLETDPVYQPSPKGNFTTSSYPLAEKYRDEGFPALDIDTGAVYEETVADPAKNKIAINNINDSNVSNPAGLNVWYQVTVKRCGQEEYWVTDPRFENDGMN